MKEADFDQAIPLISKEQGTRGRFGMFATVLRTLSQISAKQGCRYCSMSYVLRQSPILETLLPNAPPRYAPYRNQRHMGTANQDQVTLFEPWPPTREWFQQQQGFEEDISEKVNRMWHIFRGIGKVLRQLHEVQDRGRS